MIGRYPRFDVLDTVDDWDHATRRVIEQRMELHGASLRFFTPAEEPTLRAFCDICLAQDSEPRVPVVEIVDDKLANGHLDGYRYHDMPEDPDTWRLVLQGLDESARAAGSTDDFFAAPPDLQETIVDRLAHAKLTGGAWDRLNVARAWSVCMRMILSAFYSHPWAWNEIGFGGPAYPRGYMRLGPLAVLEPSESPGATDEDPVRVVDDSTDR